MREYLFDGVVGDETQDDYLLFLANSVHSVLGLEVHLRVPVGVEDDDRVGRLQVEPQPAGPR
jgi:hypothetical protein